jgi:hypothetical protein
MGKPLEKGMELLNHLAHWQLASQQTELGGMGQNWMWGNEGGGGMAKGWCEVAKCREEVPNNVLVTVNVYVRTLYSNNNNYPMGEWIRWALQEMGEKMEFYVFIFLAFL